jgi:hypothetical protein
MNDAEIGNPPRKFSIASFAMPKEQAVPRAVHWLEAIFILLHLERKHVFLVVLPMPTSFPKFRVIHVWCDYFLIPPFPILLAKVINKGIVDSGSMRQEEAGSRREFVKEE